MEKVIPVPIHVIEDRMNALNDEILRHKASLEFTKFDNELKRDLNRAIELCIVRLDELSQQQILAKGSKLREV